MVFLRYLFEIIYIALNIEIPLLDGYSVTALQLLSFAVVFVVIVKIIGSLKGGD